MTVFRPKIGKLVLIRSFRRALSIDWKMITNKFFPDFGPRTHLFSQSLERFSVILLLYIMGDDLGVVTHDLGEINHVRDISVARENLVNSVLAFPQALFHFIRLEEPTELVVQTVVIVERLLVH